MSGAADIESRYQHTPSIGDNNIFLNKNGTNSGQEVDAWSGTHKHLRIHNTAGGGAVTHRISVIVSVRDA